MDFHASAGSSLGVEVEYCIVNDDDGALTSASDELLTGLAAERGEEHPKAKRELYQSTVEVITGICATPAEAQADLAATVAEVQSALAPRGLGLVGVGVHPFARWRDQDVSPLPRYEAFIERLQWPVRRLITHGVHVHVGVRSADKAIAITGALTTYVPHLLALSASSPYWHGYDTGLASVRTKVFESMPTTGLPPALANWEEFDSLMATLVAADAVASVRDIWWDVRPHPDFGTVEMRIMDSTPTLGEVGMIAAVVQALVEWFDRRMDAGETLERLPDWVIRENKWRAARHGLDARVLVDASGTTAPLREALTRLVADLGPVATDIGSAGELMRVHDVLAVGAPNERMRAWVADGASLRTVVSRMRTELIEDRLISPGRSA